MDEVRTFVRRIIPDTEVVAFDTVESDAVVQRDNSVVTLRDATVVIDVVLR